MSLFDLTKERASQSTFSLIARIASSMSFSVNGDNEIFVFGRLNPLLEAIFPP